MTSEEVIGLPLDQALAILREKGIEADIVYSDAPTAQFSREKRTPRVVRLTDHQLLVSFFRDGRPKES